MRVSVSSIASCEKNWTDQTFKRELEDCRRGKNHTVLAEQVTVNGEVISKSLHDDNFKALIFQSGQNGGVHRMTRQQLLIEQPSQQHCHRWWHGQQEAT